MTSDIALLERWFWLAVSLTLAIFTVLLRWILERPGSRYAADVRAWQQRPGAIWAIQIARLLYALGIPTLALLWRGALTESGLGLQVAPWRGGLINWEDWMRDLGWAVFLGAGLWLLVRLSDVMVHRRVGVNARPRREWSVALREAVYHQVHWAFYREPFVLLWGLSLGTWAGLLPVAFEAGINPARWDDLRAPAHGRDLLIRVGLAIVGALLYLETQNLWLAILVDMVVGWRLGQAAAWEGAGQSHIKSTAKP